jgi:hypothetical protein
MEATTGLEPVNNGFADRSLTPWVRRPAEPDESNYFKQLSGCIHYMILWSGRRDSNPRHPAWEAGALPLNYSRTIKFQNPGGRCWI